MPKLYTTVVLLLFACTTFAQVGVGTTNPTGKLTIDASSDSTAALELVPQAVPTTNLAAGQIAVIGDKAYMYDATRLKWLSLEILPIDFGSTGARDNVYLRYVGNITNGNSGPIMPYNGTIVAITANSNNGSATKEFEVRVRNGVNTNSTHTYNLVNREFLENNTNIDFNAGDYLKVFINNDTTGDVNNLNVVLFIKWRQ